MMKTKHVLLLVLFSLNWFAIFSQTVRKSLFNEFKVLYEGECLSLNRITAMAVDKNNNLYTICTFNGKIQIGDSIFSPDHCYGVTYVSKLNSKSQVLWTIRMKGDINLSEGICYDSITNSIVTTGYFEGAIRLKDTVIYAQTHYSAFVIKFNTEGKLIFAKAISASRDVFSNDIATDQNGDIYITGSFVGKLNLIDTVLNSTIDIYNSSSSQNGDIFLIKYSKDGKFLWAKQAGGGEYDAGTAIAINKENEIYITGHFDKSATFDDTTIVVEPKGYDDNYTESFIYKVSSTGKALYLKKIKSLIYVYGNDLTVDNDDNLLFTGTFRGRVYFNDSSTLYEYGSYYSRKVGSFLAKYNKDDSLVWCKQIGGSAIEESESVFCDSKNNIYVAGLYNYKTQSQSDLVKITADSNFVWKNYVVSDYPYPYSVVSDYDDNIFYTLGLKIYKVNKFSVFAGNDTSICKDDSIKIGNSTLAYNGKPPYQYKWFNIKDSLFSTDSIIIANSDSILQFYVKATDSLNEESVDTIKIFIEHDKPHVYLGKDTFFCNGDSLILHVDKNNFYRYKWSDNSNFPSLTIKKGGLYSINVSNACGSVSDSIIISKISPHVYLGHDTVIYSNDSIILDAGSDYKHYLWSNGLDSQKIMVSIGNYHVGKNILSVKVIDSLGCTASDTINIYFHYPENIEELKWANCQLYPNPCLNYLYVKTNNDKGKFIVKIIDIKGIECKRQTIYGSGAKVFTGDLTNGIYIVSIKNMDKAITKNFLIYKK